MTETNLSERPDAPRRWGSIVLKAVAGVALLFIAGMMYLDVAQNYYRLAGFHQEIAATAVAHALADGRANQEDGYPAVPEDVQEFTGGAASLPIFDPVPIEQAEAAVAADTALVSYSMSQATEATTDGRLFVSGAGASALVGFGLLYPLVSAGIEWLELRALGGHNGQQKSRAAIQETPSGDTRPGAADPAGTDPTPPVPTKACPRAGAPCAGKEAGSIVLASCVVIAVGAGAFRSLTYWQRRGRSDRY